MKRSRLLALILAPVLALTLTACSNAAESEEAASTPVSNPVPEAMATQANPPVIVVSGTNHEMGYQYAVQVPDLIYRNIVLLKSKAVAQYGAELIETDMQVWSYYADKYDPGLRGWIEGIQAGLKDCGYVVEYNDILLVTVYSAEMWCRPPIDTPYPEETGIALPSTDAENNDEEIHSCTAFVADGEATADGNPIVGVTKMVTIEKVNTVVLVAFPDEGYSFISNPMAGSMSENAGINSAGYSWVFTAQFGAPIWGVVTEVFFHHMVQNCTSPEEAIEFLDNSPRAGVTGSFLMTSAEGGIIGYEGLSFVAETRLPGDDGETGEFLAQTNHLVKENLNQYNATPSGGSSRDRYETMMAHLEEDAANGGISLDTAKKAYTSDDWVNSETGEWTYNDPGSDSVNDNTGSMAQAVFLPCEMKAYFQVGTPNGVGLPGGATGEYIELTLGENPHAVYLAAEMSAQAYYWEARNAFVKMQNANDPALTFAAEESIRELLDVAALGIEYGMDRGGFAFLALDNGQTEAEQMKLWGDALTELTKSQLYSQMASTKLAELG